MKLKPRLRKRFQQILTEPLTPKAAKVLAIAGKSRGKVAALRRNWRNEKVEELKDLIEEGYLPHLRRPQGFRAILRQWS